jgi:hypothetical protein
MCVRKHVYGNFGALLDICILDPSEMVIPLSPLGHTFCYCSQLCTYCIICAYVYMDSDNENPLYYCLKFLTMVYKLYLDFVDFFYRLIY